MIEAVPSIVNGGVVLTEPRTDPDRTPSTRLRSRFAGLGMYVPPRVVTNSELETLLEIPENSIEKRCGILERHFVEPGTPTSELAARASLQALEQAGMRAGDLDLILLATLSPDHYFPGTACFLQERLGVPGIPVIDIRNQCSGFLYSLTVADQFIRTGTYKRILVVGAEVHSTGLDLTPAGASVSILFGDGAGAAIIVPTEEDNGLLATRLHADGSHARDLWVEAYGSGSGMQMTETQLANSIHRPKMNGRSVFKAAALHMAEVTHETLAAAGVTLDDVSLFIFHQANLRILEAVVTRLGLSRDRVYSNIERYGNTTAASIPIALTEAVAAGRVKPGDLVSFAAFGSGYAWAGALYRW